MSFEIGTLIILYFITIIIIFILEIFYEKNTYSTFLFIRFIIFSSLIFLFSCFIVEIFKCELQFGFSLFNATMYVFKDISFVQKITEHYEFIIELFKLSFITMSRVIIEYYTKTSFMDFYSYFNFSFALKFFSGFHLTWKIISNDVIIFEVLLTSFDFYHFQLECIYYIPSEITTYYIWHFATIPFIIFFIFNIYLILRIKKIIIASLNYLQEDRRTDADEVGVSHSYLKKWYRFDYYTNNLNASMKYNTEIKDAQEAQKIKEKIWWDYIKIINNFTTSRLIKLILLYDIYYIFNFFLMYPSLYSFFFFCFFLFLFILVLYNNKLIKKRRQADLDRLKCLCDKKTILKSAINEIIEKKNFLEMKYYSKCFEYDNAKMNYEINIKRVIQCKKTVRTAESYLIRDRAELEAENYELIAFNYENQIEQISYELIKIKKDCENAHAEYERLVVELEKVIAEYARLSEYVYEKGKKN